MSSLTRKALGELPKRKSKTIEIEGHQLRIQKPSPLEYSQFLAEFVKKGNDVSAMVDSLATARLVARMWIDDDGNRLFADDEAPLIVEDLDIDIYTELYKACMDYSAKAEADNESLGESEKTTDSDSPVASA